MKHAEARSLGKRVGDHSAVICNYPTTCSMHVINSLCERIPVQSFR